uniref:Uncharacterized protein n=1 Tax=Lepisosteus oculatus TaxID=7918 RepID=W5MPN0_LEPOC
RGVAGRRPQLQPQGHPLLADQSHVQPPQQDEPPVEHRGHRGLLQRREFPGLCGQAGSGLRGSHCGYRFWSLPGTGESYFLLLSPLVPPSRSSCGPDVYPRPLLRRGCGETRERKANLHGGLVRPPDSNVSLSCFGFQVGPRCGWFCTHLFIPYLSFQLISETGIFSSRVYIAPFAPEVSKGLGQ